MESRLKNEYSSASWITISCDHALESSFELSDRRRGRVIPRIFFFKHFFFDFFGHHNHDFKMSFVVPEVEKAKLGNLKVTSVHFSVSTTHLKGAPTSTHWNFSKDPITLEEALTRIRIRNQQGKLATVSLIMEGDTLEVRFENGDFKEIENFE